MLIGGHFPISQGLDNAVDLLIQAGGNTLQIFTKNPGQWRAKKIKEEEIRSFKDKISSAGVEPVIVHDSYLINLATKDQVLREKSIKAFTDEILRAESIGAKYIVTHMGAHKGDGEEEAIKILTDSINRVINETISSPVVILLETTAGQGTQIGYKFEHLQQVIEGISAENSHRVGVCLDTCHIFSAGYDISTPQGYEETFKKFDQTIGLNRLKAIHLNDDKKPLASRVDRHDHIGRGTLGIETFRRIVNDIRFKEVPMILETPAPETMHKVNIEILKGLLM